ncbi:unannotated protein [freshwater metagenome]|uniref:Unannotated protein n=1 Tax=freshwater metagenome TaxID=449393 RepID=A0A6J6XA34_9ZZZZ
MGTAHCGVVGPVYRRVHHHHLGRLAERHRQRIPQLSRHDELVHHGSDARVRRGRPGLWQGWRSVGAQASVRRRPLRGGRVCLAHRVLVEPAHDDSVSHAQRFGRCSNGPVNHGLYQSPLRARRASEAAELLEFRQRRSTSHRCRRWCSAGRRCWLASHLFCAGTAVPSWRRGGHVVAARHRPSSQREVRHRRVDHLGCRCLCVAGGYLAGFAMGMDKPAHPCVLCSQRRWPQAVHLD